MLQRENIEVEASHIGLAVNPGALYAVVDRLSQPEGNGNPLNGSVPGNGSIGMILSRRIGCRTRGWFELAV